MYHSQCLNQTYASALYLILTCKNHLGTAGLHHVIRQLHKPEVQCHLQRVSGLDLTGLTEAEWKNHTHPVTCKKPIPVPLDLKL